MAEELTYDDFIKLVGEDVGREFVRNQVKGVQQWMALDLHMALGYDTNPDENGGLDSWADWWSELLAEVRWDQTDLQRYEKEYEQRRDMDFR